MGITRREMFGVCAAAGLASCGVFATHSPVRPNLIALTTCKVLSVEGGMVTIDKIDAFDDTPILDLKSAGSRKGTPLLRRGE